MPPTGSALARLPTGATATGTTRGRRGREALGAQTLHRRSRQLQTCEGSIFDPRADPGVNQPPPGRGAATPPGAHLNAPKAPGVVRLAGPGGLSPEGELGAKDQGGGR